MKKSTLLVTILAATGSVNAASLQTTSSAFTYTTNPANVLDYHVSSSGGFVSASGLGAGTLSASELSKFNSSNGVLTGVEFFITSAQTLTVDGVLQRSSGSTYGSVTGKALASTQVGAGNSLNSGITTTTTSYNFLTATSGEVRITTTKQATSNSAQLAANYNQILAAENLNNFVGNDSISVGSSDASGVRLTFTPSALTAQLNANSSSLSAQSSAISSLLWSGDVGFNYSFLDHAVASFDGSNPAASLTIDFGSVAQNSSPANQAFSIFNAIGDLTGLDFTGIGSSSGDTGKFSTDLASNLFDNLAAGSGTSYSASLDTSTPGNFLATYTLTFRDDDGTGASASRLNNQTLSLTLKGDVVAPVPVPGAVWLFGTGLLGLLGLKRRDVA